LSAVDVRVANTIFDGIERYVATRASPKACLMALNQLHFLPRFDWVVVMQHGSVVEQGRFEDIKDLSNGALHKLLQDQPSANELVDDQPSTSASTTTMTTSSRMKKTETTSMASFYLPGAATLSGTVNNKETTTMGEPNSNKEETPQEEEDDGDDEPAATESVPQEEEKAKTPQTATTTTIAEGSKPAAGNELVSEEKGARGTGVTKVIKEYIRRMGLIQIPMTIFLGCSAYAIMSANDLLLAFWIQDAQTFTFDENINRALIYFGLSVAHVLMVEFLSLWNMRGSVRSSRQLHADVVETLLHAPVSFYESTPSGRIVSRLAGDLNMADRSLAFVFDDLFHFTFLLIGLTIIIGIIIPPLLAFMLSSFVFFAIQLVYVDRTNREAKRFANQAMSGVLTNLSETVNARTICQLMGYEAFFVKRHCDALDEQNRYGLLSYSVVNWGTMITGLISFIVSTGAAFLVVFLRDQLDPALIGLALVYSLIQPYFLGILSSVLPLGLSALTSLERILEFCSDSIPSERPWHTPVDAQVAPWPTRGDLTFENVVLVYRPGLPPSLKGVNFHVQGGEVVGIVGR